MSEAEIHHSGRRLSEQLLELADVSDEAGQTTRTFLSAGMRRANAMVGQWMRDAGLNVREDSVGNLIGRSEGNGAKAKTLLLGSHLDSVRNAGRFDGPLGVLLPIAALTALRERGIFLPFAVEVIGFSEEEGVRFSSAYLGSKGYVGALRESDLVLRDEAGVDLLGALKAINGGEFTLPQAAHPKRDLLGYVEVHIEQGPVLESANLAVGVVSAIAGQTRARLTFIGKAGHAGTTPMRLRRDAFAGAAEFALAAEKLGQRTSGLVATVGTITVRPGAPNVIPAEAVFSLDLRHALDAKRKSALKKLKATGQRIARERGLRFKWEVTQENGAVECSPELTHQLEKSVKAIQGRSRTMVSGAGHDGVVMKSLTPVAMLFVRCRDGLSHHPDEYASPQDLGVALQVMVDFLEQYGKSVGRHQRPL